MTRLLLLALALPIASALASPAKGPKQIIRYEAPYFPTELRNPEAVEAWAESAGFPGFATSGDLLITPREGALAPQSTLAIPDQWVMSYEPLFLPGEQRNLVAIGAKELAYSMKVVPMTGKHAEAIMNWCKVHNPGWAVQHNAGIRLHSTDADAQFLRYQWGLQNTGQTQGLELDTNLTAPLPGMAGQDMGALRANPQPTGIPAGQTKRPKVIVAVLDTGLDYDRDLNGGVAKIHPNLAGQTIDKTGPGEECDPADFADRVAKLKSCVQSGATDCLTRSTVKPGVADFDRDGNGYPLDCMGWNLTGALTPKTDLLGDNNTTDRLGHGTHVAGIIAATAAADGTGVRGVMTRNVAILPVKVVSEAPNQPRIPQDLHHTPSSKPAEPQLLQLLTIPDPRADIPLPQEHMLNPTGGAVAFTDQIARGILYAIRSGAKVISMSLAWPSNVDSDLMRRMIKLAHDQGILIVASAGNDSTEARTMPCLRSEVVCVGSHDPSGNPSYFTNFGAGVDVAAPGDDILSTWPRALSAGRKWTTGLGGYEMVSGTSMAAPFVSGSLARLLDEGYTPDTAVAALFAGTRPTATPTARLGNIDLELAEKTQPQPLILPDPKGPIVIRWDPNSETAPFSFGLKNFWAAAGATQVSIALETDSEPTLAGAKIEVPSPTTFDSWPAQGSKDPAGNPADSRQFQAQIHFAGDLKQRLRLNGRFAARISVNTSGVTRTFEQPLELVATIDSTHAFAGEEDITIDPPLDLTADIRTVNPHDGDPSLEYMVRQTAQGKFTLNLYREEPAQPPLAPKFTIAATITRDAIPGELVLADVQRVDHQIGQKSGYVLIYQTRPPQGANIPGVRFDFYDHNLEFVKTLRYDNVVATIDSQHWVWIKANDSTSGADVRVPAWVAFGLLPKEQYPDPDFYGCFFVASGKDCKEGTAQMDSDDWRALHGLQQKYGLKRNQVDGKQVLIQTMSDLGQDHFQRNRIYFLEPEERQEISPTTGKPLGDVKAIAHVIEISPEVPSNRNLRVRGQPHLPDAATKPEFHDYVPLELLAQSNQERQDGSIRLLLARPETNANGNQVDTLVYAVGRVQLATALDAQGNPTWGVTDLATILKPDQTRNLVSLPDVISMLPLGRASQSDPSATFMGQALDHGLYESNVIVPQLGQRASTPSTLPDIQLHTVGPAEVTDSVFRAAGAFAGAKRLAMFGETHFDLQYNDLTSGEHAEENLGRFSFMPQAVFSMLLFPVVVGDEQSTSDLLPGIMIPAQLRSAPNLEVIIPNYVNGKLARLITPARLRLQAGQGCRAISNPTQATSTSVPSLVFLCGSKFALVPMTY